MKTLTTYEALKANETKRVRPVGSEAWWEVREMIKALDGGLLQISYGACWEAEEPLIERWVAVDPDGKLMAYYNTFALAQERVLSNERIVHLREVRS